MHMSDALVSPPVAIGAGIISVSLIILASRKLKDDKREDIIPLMGMMGAFVFAAQMINFTIPGTGSSGHIIGGILLSAILGPWAAFLTLCSILMVQCLIFADGGLLALGCNILNMAVTSCLIAYPFIYKPIVVNSMQSKRIIPGAILASIIALVIGAFGVTIETELSGITSLPFATFLTFMISIHIVIGIIEGIITGALLFFLAIHRPNILNPNFSNSRSRIGKKSIFLIIGLVTLILAGGFTFLASELPDGLEWSIGQVSENSDLIETSGSPTAIMPEYNSSFSGIIGALIVMALIWSFSSVIFSGIKKNTKAE